MSTHSFRHALVVIVAGLIVAGPTFGSRVRAQNVVQTWAIEDIAQAGDTIGNSVTVANGIAFDPLGRLVLAWGDTCACGGFEHETWARREGGAWQITSFLPGPENSTLRDWNNTHAMALTPSGTPIMVFDSRYAGGAYVDAIWSFKSDLNADPTGAAPVIFAGVSGIDHWADIGGSQYAVVPAPDEGVRTARFTGTSRIILNGAVFANTFAWLGFGDYAVTPDGVDHVTYGAAIQTYLPADVHYLRRDVSGAATDTILRADAWETALASDPSGGLHSVIKGGPASQGNYGGTLEYRTSTDSGATWSDPELVDPVGSAFHATVAIDRNGVPGVAYWQWGYGLFFATREGGAWQVSQVYAPNGWNVRESTLQPRLAFDANNQPNIFFWDWETAQMRLAVGSSVAPPPPPPPTNHPPVAMDDAASTDENASVRIPVLLNDTDPDADDLRVTAVTPGKYGMTAINGDLTVTYTPAPGFFGTDVFTYTVDDGHGGSAVGTVIVTVQPTPLDLRPQACQVPRDGLVALWGGDGSPADASGNHHDGIVHGSVGYRPGAVDTAFRFDGSSGYVEAGGDDNAFYPGDGAFTLSAWVKTTSRDDMTIVAKDECDGNGACPAGWGSMFYLGMTQGYVVAYVRAGANTAGGDGEPLQLGAWPYIADGRYHHVALVRQNVPDFAPITLGVFRLYIDGTEQEYEATSFVGSLEDDNGVINPLTIGAAGLDSPTIGAFFNGALDDVALYHRDLTPAELLAIAQSRAACGPPDDTVPPTLTVPSDIAAEATRAAGAIVNYAVDAVDALDGPVAVTCSQASGTTFGIGGTFVTCSSTDLDGNNSTNSFLVTVRDTTPPVLVLPGNITTDAPAAGGTSMPASWTATAMDIVDGAVPATCAPPSGSNFAIGTTNVICTATDHAGNVRSGGFTVTVPPARPPIGIIVTNPGDQVSYLDDDVTLPIVATDSNGYTLTFTPSNTKSTANTFLPLGVPGLRINRLTGVIHGFPTQPGTFNVVITVKAPPDSPVVVAFSWTVKNHRRPSMRQPRDQATTAGDAVALQIHATPAGSLTYSATGLPIGLRIDPSSGLIRGNPTLANVGLPPSTVTVTVVDSENLTASRTFSWVVVGSDQTDLFVEMALAIAQGGTVDHSRLELTVTFGNHGPRAMPVASYDPLNRAVAHIAVPDDWADAAWTCAGTLINPHFSNPWLTPAGTPAANQVRLFQGGETGSVDLNIALPFNPNHPPDNSIVCTALGPFHAQSDLLVDAVATIEAGGRRADPYLGNNIAALRYPAPAKRPFNHAPTMAAPGDQDWVQNDPVMLQLSAVDPDGDPLRFGIVAGKLPKGLVLDYRSGEIGGTAGLDGGFYDSITVAATDGSAVVTRAFAWDVAGRTVTLANPGDRSNVAGVPVRLDLQVADSAGFLITVTASGLPAGLTLHSSADHLTWWISGTPTKRSLGSHFVTLTASSGGMPPVVQTFTWTIGN